MGKYNFSDLSGLRITEKPEKYRYSSVQINSNYTEHFGTRTVQEKADF